MAVRRMPLRTDRRVGNTFVTNVPADVETMFIIGAAINIEPNLDGKPDIDRKAIKLRTQFDLGTPRAAIPSAALLSATNATRTRLIVPVVALTPTDARRHIAAVQSS